MSVIQATMAVPESGCCAPHAATVATVASHAATVAVVIFDHGPFSPSVLIQRAM